MKILSLILTLGSLNVFAAQSLYCHTEKSEADPSNSWFRNASDSNQRIQIPLDSSGQPEGSSLLQYEFSQSSGGSSVWSLFVKSATLNEDKVTLIIDIRQKEKVFMSEKLEITLSPAGAPDAPRNEAVVANPLIAPVAGQTVYYSGETSEELSQGLIANLISNVDSHKMKRGDLAWINVGFCRLQ